MTKLMTRDELAQYVPARVLDFSDVIVTTEGGFVNNLADHGGATNDGISLVWANKHGQQFDLNHDGRVTAADIRLITPEIAACAFIQFFFIDVGLGILPPAIMNNAFDTSVNCGPGVPTGLAQKAFNALRDTDPVLHAASSPLKIDGKLGGVSIRALFTAVTICGAEALNNAYADVRIARYHSIVDNNHSQEEFLEGWLNRANHLRDLTIEDADASSSGE